MAAVLARADLNRDGSLSAREYDQVGEEGNFLELDPDRDGAITLEELNAWVHLTEPRPEGMGTNPAALMAALDRSPASTPAAPTLGVGAAAGASRGKPPKPDPSVLVVGGTLLAWGFALWATARALPGASA